MALEGVMRPGHAQVRVLELDKAVTFYRDVLGLVETGRDDSGRVYFKCWDERDHHSLILREADEAGIDFLAFKVRDELTLDVFRDKLEAAGIETEEKAAGDLLETGRRVRFTLPSGHLIELFATKTQVGNGIPMTNPGPWCEQSERGIAPIRFDHALLYGPNIAEVKKIFIDILGFYLVERVLTPDGEGEAAIWLSCGQKVHDVAFAEYPEPGKLHHCSFLMESWEKVLRAGDIMSMNEVDVDIGPTRHGITRGCTIYAWDPSGNRFETFMGGYLPYPDYEPLTWTFDNFGQGLDYPQRKLHETFLTVVT
ncbi:catechol 2,3-dioxygenase [Novosphingobium naphthalenivorans]|uniref:catechol 2,3-dioxygenase n=1 Tax=Novosphingobium naphthalenivorans TaxID=273168 RepID=UPI0008299CE6|nr:catechol 2,3-dioxygenase [Novosphingobium naphthalenivorans]